MDRSTPQDSFLVDLEKAAKALSVVADRETILELRSLFDRLQKEHGPTSARPEPVDGKDT